MFDLRYIQVEQDSQDQCTESDKTICQYHHPLPFPTVDKDTGKQSQY